MPSGDKTSAIRLADSVALEVEEGAGVIKGDVLARMNNGDAEKRKSEVGYKER